jgi:predicted RNase H-like nuclease (RuvC/YqgF family)
VRNIDQPAVQPMEAGQENHEAWEQRLMGGIVRDNEGDDAWEQHLREHGIIRGDQQVPPAEDRQREALREREREREGRGFEYTIRIMRMQNEIEEFRSRVTRLRTQTEKIHHRRMSASDRRNLMELDVEIMELEAQIKKLERELQAVTGPADSATLPSLWGDTPYTSWKTLD